jgi:hypothetical protein
MNDPDSLRRGLVFGAAATGALAASSARGQAAMKGAIQTETGPCDLAGKSMP